MASDTVYLVEDHLTDAKPGYWAHVYLSREQARSGCEHWAKKRELQALSWDEEGYDALMATVADSEERTAAYTIVPLSVRRPGEPEN
ncbi:hypothetical protein ACHZ98_35500 [Streptomyces sp. MAR4 CNY-716]